MKIERAKELFIDNPWMPISAVGAAVGYEEPTTFGRAFKRYQSITPRVYVALARGLSSLNGSTSALARQRRILDVIRHADVSPTILPHLTDLANEMDRVRRRKRAAVLDDRRKDPA